MQPEGFSFEDGIFRYRFVVPAKFVDMLGHVNNTAYVRWMQDAAIYHSQHLDWPWERYVELGAAFVIRRQVIDYLLPLKDGETVDVATRVVSMSQSSSVRATEMQKPTGELVLKAETTWIFVSLETGRPTKIPAPVRVAFDRKN